MAAKSIYDVDSSEEIEPVKKKRHRRTKAELLKDPEYCAKHGIPCEAGIEAPVSEEPKKRGRKKEEPDADYGEDVPEEEPRKAPRKKRAIEETYEDVEWEESSPPEDAERVDVKPPPASQFKRIFKTRWAFDIWDSKTETCVRTQQLPDWVTTEDEAYEETKKYCNENVRVLAGCNIVVYEVHKEFRLAVTQVVVQE